MSAARAMTPDQVAEVSITRDQLRNRLSYDPGTGAFIWRGRGRTRGTSLQGSVAGSPAGGGYIMITIDGHRYYAHRLAWLYVTGRWPTEQIDHADGDRSNNRWANLREATTSQNRINRLRPPRPSGLPRGVIKRGSSFGAKIKHQGESIWLGTFQTLAEAEAAYEAAAKRLFGDFLTERARLGAGHE